MPTALMLTEDALPKYNERENDEQRIKDIYSYLFMLVEQLRYSLGNLGASNFNDTELDLLGEDITKELDDEVKLISHVLVGETGSLSQIIASGDAIYTRLSNIEGDVTELYETADGLMLRIADAEDGLTEVIATVNGLTFKVSNGEESSTLKLYSGATLLTSANIKITGYVTFSDLEGEGTTVINGANVSTGTITAIEIAACDIYGSDIHGSNVTLYYDHDEYDDCAIYFDWGGSKVGYLGFEYDTDYSDRPFVMLSSKFSTDLWLKSAADMYINVKRDLYVNATDITLTADAVYIDNPVLYDEDGGEWTFSQEGIFRNGVLHFPI